MFWPNSIKKSVFPKDPPWVQLNYLSSSTRIKETSITYTYWFLLKDITKKRMHGWSLRDRGTEPSVLSGSTTLQAPPAVHLLRSSLNAVLQALMKMSVHEFWSMGNHEEMRLNKSILSNVNRLLGEPSEACLFRFFGIPSSRVWGQNCFFCESFMICYQTKQVRQFHHGELKKEEEEFLWPALKKVVSQAAWNYHSITPYKAVMF